MRIKSFFAVFSLLLGTSCVPPLEMRADSQGSAKPQTAAQSAPRSVAGIAPGILLHSAGIFGQPGAGTPLAVAPVQNALLTVTPAPAFSSAAASADDSARALDCLTAAIYYEARSESEDGQRAVAQVVLNRVRSPAFPSSVCGVVYEGSKRTTGCQFSFTCDGSMLAGVRNPTAWVRARLIAQTALAGYVYEPVGTATFYHANYVSPWWAPSLAKVTQIGAHIFYRWPGSWGEPGALRQAYAGVEPKAGGGSDAETTMEGVMRLAVDGGIITIHRGVDLPAGSIQTVAGVRVHFGTASDGANGAPASSPAPALASADPVPAPAASSSDAPVAIHRGTMPGGTAAGTGAAPGA